MLSLGKICHRKACSAQKTSVQLLWLPATTHQPTSYGVHIFIPATRGCQGVCQLVSRLVCLRSEVPAAPLTLKATNLCYLIKADHNYSADDVLEALAKSSLVATTNISVQEKV